MYTIGQKTCNKLVILLKTKMLELEIITQNWQAIILN